MITDFPYHPQVSRMVRSWQKCRDAATGSRAIKDAGTTYLPKLHGQTPQGYANYQGRALWYGATGRTIDGMLGAVMRREPLVELPEGIRRDFDNVDGQGSPFPVFAKQVLAEIIEVGRHGILIDYPKARIDAMGERYQRDGVRPYWVRYSAEQIVNWKTEQIGGVETLRWVVLKETFLAESEKQEFSLTEKVRYRVLEINTDGNYQTVVYNQAENSREWLPEAPIVPRLFGGKPLTEIPFVFVGVNGIDSEISEPPLLALAEVNISHYMTSADLENGRHYAGLPQLIVMGAESNTVLEVGSAKAWKLPVDGDAKYVEFQGAGLGELRLALEEKQRMMAALGARLLEDPRKGIEAADSIRLRTAGETANLAAMAASVSRALTQAAKWHARFAGSNPDKVRIQLNDDLVDSRLSNDDITALMLLFQAGGISFDTLHYQLQKGEVIPAGVTPEEELKKIRERQLERGDSALFGEEEE